MLLVRLEKPVTMTTCQSAARDGSREGELEIDTGNSRLKIYDKCLPIKDADRTH